jgi:hypothetical protein
MKTKNWICTLLMTIFLVSTLQTVGVASNGKTKATSHNNYEISQYLSSVSFPSSFKGGIVMVRFTLDDQKHIQNVMVYTDNKDLKEGITQSLFGKTFKSVMPVSYQEKNQNYYVLRLHITLS